MFVTAQTQDREKLLAEVVDALAALDLDARLDGDTLVVDGSRLGTQIVSRAHPTPADLTQLVSATPGRVPAMVVADRISDAGRDVLRNAGWGWFDRRGHLRIWASGLRMESPLPVVGDGHGRSRTTNPWTTVGLEISLAALCDPTTPISARRVAALIGRSAGATHELISRFVELGLIGTKTHLPLLPELFWETTAKWPDDGWIGLTVSLNEVAERVGADELIRVDERAATMGGARIAAAGDLPARSYVRSAGALRRARSLGERSSAERDAPARCWVRATPIRWMPLNDDHPADAEHPWAIAHPLVCALRLAADPARGREIVDDWGIVPGAR